VPAQQERVDTRELVDLLSRDPEWVRRQFEEIVATSFPPEDPPSAPRVLAGTVGPAPSGPVTVPPGGSRAPDDAHVGAGAGHGHRQRSPPRRAPRQGAGRKVAANVSNSGRLSVHRSCGTEKYSA
jgi:hypothetical protein